MRRMFKVLVLFSVLAVLNVATVCVFLSAIPVRAGLTEPEVCLQGDINGDGSRSLADALKLLNFLFQEAADCPEIFLSSRAACRSNATLMAGIGAHELDIRCSIAA